MVTVNEGLVFATKNVGSNSYKPVQPSLNATRQQRGNGLPERDVGRVFAGPGVGTSPKARERFCEGPPRTGRVSFVHTGGSLLIV